MVSLPILRCLNASKPVHLQNKLTYETSKVVLVSRYFQLFMFVIKPDKTCGNIQAGVVFGVFAIR